MTNEKIKEWVKKNLKRAKEYGCRIELEVQDVIDINISDSGKCAYCNGVASLPSFAFPLKLKAPCVPANILLCCEQCRIKKKEYNIIKYCKTGEITKETLKALITLITTRKGGTLIKAYIRTKLGEPDEQTRPRPSNLYNQRKW